jgi:hypothetical protein
MTLPTPLRVNAERFGIDGWPQGHSPAGIPNDPPIASAEVMNHPVDVAMIGQHPSGQGAGR